MPGKAGGFTRKVSGLFSAENKPDTFSDLALDVFPTSPAGTATRNRGWSLSPPCG
jgi:hypothetical protein